MLISLRQIYSLADKKAVTEIYTGYTTSCYMSAQLCKTMPKVFDAGTVYFLHSSQLPKSLPDNDVGFVVLSDSNYNFSGRETERIIISDESAFKSLYSNVVSFISQKAAESYLQERMLSNLFSGKTEKEMLDLGSDMLNNPLVAFLVEDNKYILLHSYIRDVRGKLSTPDHYEKTANGKKLMEMHMKDAERILALPYPIMFEAGANFKGERRIATTIKDETGKSWGGLVLYEKQSEITENDYSSLFIIGNILGKKISYNYRNGYRFTPHTQYILDLIQGESGFFDTSWLDAINGRIRQNFRIILLDLSTIDQVSRGKVETRIFMSMQGVLSAKRTPYLVLLINPKNESEYHQQCELLEPILENFDIHGSVSESFSDINTLRKYYEQAKQILSISFDFHTDTRLHSYSNYKYYALINSLPRNINLSSYISEDYRVLSEHDKTKGTDYCNTLIMLIFNNSHKVVCDKLHIHRNTLPQRLSKMEEMLNHPVTGTDFLLDFYFSYMIDTFFR